MAKKKKKAVTPEVLPAKMGAPRKEIDWDQFEELCHMQCTKQEIAMWFRCSEANIENKVFEEYGETFSAIFSEKRTGGQISLRRSQFQLACSGNPTMLIWLGKNQLNQLDQPEVKKTETEVDRLIINFSGKQLEEDKDDDE